MQYENVKITENDVKRQVKQFLQYNGWFVFHVLQGLGCYPGVSDLIAIRDSYTVFIECKRPEQYVKKKKVKGGAQSKYQEKFQEDVESKGCEYILAQSLDDVKHLGNTLLF